MKDVDTKYNGWDKNSDVQGPMTQRLNDFGRVEGLVVGVDGEGSPDLLHLISRIVKRAAMMKFSTMGFSTCSVRGAKTVSVVCNVGGGGDEGHDKIVY